MNMKTRILALVFALSAGAASAQQTNLPNIALPSQSVIGNALPVPSTANAIPLAQLQTLLSALPNAPTSPIVSVKTVGAKGDGVADDYSIINGAITVMAAAGGGTLFFPAGTYLMSSALVPVSGVNIQGAGRDVTIIKGQGIGLSPFNCSMVIAATFTGGNHQENLSGTAITYPIDAPIEGTNTVKTTTNANAGNFAAGQTILITGDLHGTNFWYPDWFTTVVSANAGTGIITLAENLPFGGANITTVQRLLTVPQNIKISDMTILGAGSAAFQITGTQNVTLDNVAVRAGSGGVTLAGAEFSANRNSALQNSVGYGIVVDMLGCIDCRIVNNVLNGGQLSFDGGSQNSIASGNVVNSPSSNGSPSNGILLGALANRIRILGNTVTNVPASLAGINLFNNDGGNHLIESNTVTGVDTTTTLGIAINNSVNNTVVGNWLNHLAFGVIVANNATGQLIDANTILNTTTPYSIDNTSSIRQPFVMGPLTIAALPACTVGFTGARATVSNGVATPTYQGAVSTTGAATQPVFCNGSGWVYD